MTRQDSPVPDAIIKSGLIHQTGQEWGRGVTGVMTGELRDERPERWKEAAGSAGRKRRGVCGRNGAVHLLPLMTR